MKNLLIVDLEATCFARGEEPSGFTSEIIEIGAVLLDTDTRQITREYQAMVKPAQLPLLGRYCIALTGISQDEVDMGVPLNEALGQLAAMYALDGMVFSSWGFYDQRQIERECARKGIPNAFAKDHISLKHNHASFYGLAHPLGMDAALAYHQLPLIGRHHRALDDARNIAVIAVRMLEDGWTHRRLRVETA